MTEMIKVNDIDAYLARPDGEVKQTVIVIHEVWGLTDHIKSIADRLAAGGYLALAPDLLSQALDMPKIRQYQIDTLNPEKRTAIQPSLRELMTPIQSPEYAENTITQLKEVFNYLHNMPEAKQRVAVMGFCFGGTYSFNLAVAEPC
jgi:carboxymethylenebutenolidase